MAKLINQFLTLLQKQLFSLPYENSVAIPHHKLQYITTHHLSLVFSFQNFGETKKTQ